MRTRPLTRHASPRRRRTPDRHVRRAEGARQHAARAAGWTADSCRHVMPGAEHWLPHQEGHAPHLVAIQEQGQGRCQPRSPTCVSVTVERPTPRQTRTMEATTRLVARLPKKTASASSTCAPPAVRVLARGGSPGGRPDLLARPACCSLEGRRRGVPLAEHTAPRQPAQAVWRCAGRGDAGRLAARCIRGWRAPAHTPTAARERSPAGRAPQAQQRSC